MAGESISSPVTQDIAELDGGNSRRNSLAGANSANSGEKTLSRYLRASTTSCHDFCKFGKKHESEEKAARHPVPKRIMKVPFDEPNLFESLDLSRRKKISAIKSKSFLSSRTHTPDTSEAIKLQTSGDSPGGNNSRIHVVLSMKKMASVAKLKTKYSPNSRSHSDDTSDIINLEVPTNFSDGKSSRKSKRLLEEKKTSMAKLKSSPNLKSHLSDAPKFMQQDRSLPSGRVRVSSKEVPSKAKEKSFRKHLTTSFNLKSRAEKLPFSVSSEGLSVSRNSGIGDMKMRKRTVTSKVALKEVLSSPRASFSRRASLGTATSLTARKNRNLKVEPPQKNQNKVKMAETEQLLDEHVKCNNDTLQEKTLYVIKLETENIMLDSDKNENCAAELSLPVPSSPESSSLPTSPSLSSHSGGDQDESECTVTEAEDDSDSEDDEDDTVNMEEADILEWENGGMPGKAGMVFSDDQGCQPEKLTFRRGKVIEIQFDNNGPRRLKFRRGIVLGENQIGKAEGDRTFRRKGADGDTDGNEHGEEKVVLRHQDLLGNKDEKGLLNNVIEETASKLVETRKSKVKALVSAFETVISLQ